MPSTLRAAILCTFIGLAACESKPPVTATPSPTPVQAGALTLPEDAPASSHFAAVRIGTPGAPEVIGSYTRGCISGASQLPLDGEHWQVVHPSRNRAWGHPNLIAFVSALGDRVGQIGLQNGKLAFHAKS